MDSHTRTALLEHFDRLFPVGPGHWPYWKEEPHRSALFSIFREAHRREQRIHGDEVLALLQTDWLPARDDVDGNDRAVLREMCTAWSEWLYAVEQFAPVDDVPHRD